MCDLDDRIKKNEMDVACGINGGRWCIYKILLKIREIETTLKIEV
jgi:hypothetical protein